MTITRPSAAVTTPQDIPQQAYLAIELPPADEVEMARQELPRRHVQDHAHQVDLRELVPVVREVMGPGCQVGCGSSHIWLRRAGTPARLAIIADRLTTAYSDWPGFRPPMPAPNGRE